MSRLWTFTKRAVVFLALCLAGASSSAAATEKVALIVGNYDYTHFYDLNTPGNDADVMAEKLGVLGFKTFVHKNLDKAGLEKALRGFYRDATGAEIALVYYAGHGLQVSGQNYMVPTDAQLINPEDLELELVGAQFVSKYLQSRARNYLIILDACRNVPDIATSQLERRYELADLPHQMRGLARAVVGAGALIAYSTSPGSFASDGSGTNSPYTGALADFIDVPGLEVREIFTNVRRTVIQSTNGQQMPWEDSALTDKLYFIEPVALPKLASKGNAELALVKKGEQGAEYRLTYPPMKDFFDSRVRFVISELPDSFRLSIDGAAVSAGTSYDLGDFSRLAVTVPAGVTAGIDAFAFTLTSDTGGEVSSLVLLRQPEEAAEPARQEDISGLTEALARLSLDMTFDVDFAGFPKTDAFGRLAAAPDDLFVVFDSVPDGLTIKAGDRLLSTGDRIALSALPALAFRHEFREGVERGVLRYSIFNGAEKHRIETPVTVRVDRCDVLASAPFDIQAIQPGVLEAQLDVPAVIAACEEAVSRFPGTGRFKYQLSRGFLAKRDGASAEKLAKAAAAQGHYRGNTMLSHLYFNGFGVKKDAKRARSYANEAAAAGEIAGIHNRGRMAFYAEGASQKAIEEGLADIRKAAEVGLTEAINELGWIYLGGQNGVPKQEKRGFELFQIAARIGDRFALNNIGYAYRKGMGVEQSFEQAKSFFERAVENGSFDGANNIGVMYELGELGAEPDIRAALEWYVKAAEMGSVNGAENAGRAVTKLSGDRMQALQFHYLALAFETTGRQAAAAREQTENVTLKELRALRSLIESKFAPKGVDKVGNSDRGKLASWIKAALMSAWYAKPDIVRTF